ncbi:MAG: protein kinase [Rickettsiales bacterium]|jgi:serine/threonine protein kinase|nr:protein kinase [Rickettsiales bacterium]
MYGRVTEELKDKIIKLVRSSPNGKIPLTEEDIARLNPICIGNGVSGSVWSIYSSRLGKNIVVKEINPKGVVDDSAKEIFKRGELLYFEHCKKVNSPFLAKTYYAQGDLVIMEYCEGKDLGKLIKEEPKEAKDAAIGVLYCVISGLAELHGYGLAHRDIKPGNIIYDSKTDRFKIIDFGSMRKFSKQDDADYFNGCTLWYIPPEEFEEHNSSFTYRGADMWAAGLTILGVLLGKDAEDILSDFFGEKLNLFSYAANFAKTITSEPEKWKTFLENCLSGIKPSLGENFQFFSELLFGMLEPNCQKRWDANRALELVRRIVPPEALGQQQPQLQNQYLMSNNNQSASISSPPYQQQMQDQMNYNQFPQMDFLQPQQQFNPSPSYPQAGNFGLPQQQMQSPMNYDQFSPFQQQNQVQPWQQNQGPMNYNQSPPYQQQQMQGYDQLSPMSSPPYQQQQMQSPLNQTPMFSQPPQQQLANFGQLQQTQSQVSASYPLHYDISTISQLPPAINFDDEDDGTEKKKKESQDLTVRTPVSLQTHQLPTSSSFFTEEVVITPKNYPMPSQEQERKLFFRSTVDKEEGIKQTGKAGWKIEKILSNGDYEYRGSIEVIDNNLGSLVPPFPKELCGNGPTTCECSFTYEPRGDRIVSINDIKRINWGNGVTFTGGAICYINSDKEARFTLVNGTLTSADGNLNYRGQFGNNGKPIKKGVIEKKLKNGSIHESECMNGSPLNNGKEMIVFPGKYRYICKFSNGIETRGSRFRGWVARIKYCISRLFCLQSIFARNEIENRTKRIEKEKCHVK